MMIDDSTMIALAARAGAVGNDAFKARPGELTLANAQVSYNSPFSERLTAYAVGIRDGGGLRELREFIAPTVRVNSRKFDFLEIDDLEKFKAVTKEDAIRARGGEFRSLSLAGHVRTESLQNFGFTTPVEFADMAEDPNLSREAVDMLIEAVDTVELLWAFDVLDGLATAETISIADSPDIDAAIKQKLQENYDATGVAANRVFFGGGAWAKREFSYRNASLTPGTINYAKTPEQVGADLGADVRVGDARAVTTAGAMSVVRSNDIYAFFAVPGATRYDATNVKFFTAPGLNGRTSEVYQSDNYQGVIRHVTLSRWGAPRVGNGFGVIKFTLTD